MSAQPDILERLAVAELVLTERRSRDRADWETMAAAYHPDSEVHTSWFRGTGAEFVAAGRRMYETHGWRATHRLAPVFVTVKGGRALAEVNIALEIRSVFEEIEIDLTTYGRLLYRARSTAEGWRLTSLAMIYERDTISPVVPGQALPVTPADLAAHRASYRFLSYVTTRSGGDPSADLPGDDRPDLVEAVYRSAGDWLEGVSA
jgi:SnoaL-like domain